MKRQVIFGTMFSAALAVGVSAQQPPSAQPPAGQPPSQSGGQVPGDRGQASQREQPLAEAQVVTLIGCVQPAGQAGAASSTAAPGSTSSPGSTAAGGFVLVMASAAPPAGATTGTTGSASGSTGTTGSMSGRSATSYRLSGSTDQNLGQYVGQRVEITGTTTGRAASATGVGSSTTGSSAGSPTGSAPSATGSTGSATGAAPSGSMASGGHSASMPGLRVTTIKPTPGSCTQ